MLMRYIYQVKKLQFANLGFTLIELLVTFSLISMVSGLGFVSLTNYIKRQSFVQAAQDVKQSINIAKFNALSGVKPNSASCTSANGLVSYMVTFCDFSSFYPCIDTTADYEIEALCGGSTVAISSKKLPQNITFSTTGLPTPCSYLIFGSLNSTIQGGTCSIYINGNGSELTFTVDSSGYVSF